MSLMTSMGLIVGLWSMYSLHGHILTMSISDQPLTMSIQRRIERHQLPYYLKVFNRVTDKPMGYIGNISREGLMLISPWPMLVLAEFDMRLKIPGPSESQSINIDFSAICRWTREDVTPGSFDSGFELIGPPAEYLELVEALRQYFTFHSNAASA